VVLLFAAAFGVARAEEATLDRVKAQAPTVKRWGGRILIAVGVWFLVLALFADFFEGVFPV
jgi:multisubunit Na+/H+ antiporter MnhB subunit